MDYAQLIAALSALGVYPVKPGGGGGGGTVTSVSTGVGLTGGPITASGTIEFADIATGRILANISGEDDYPTPNTLTGILDALLGNTQGDLMFRGATAWEALGPAPIAGYFLKSGGISADVDWATPPTNQIYFDVNNGDNDNPGTEGSPVETLAYAYSLAAALIGGGATFVRIIGVGTGIDTSNVTVTVSGIDIYAPGIQHNPPTGDALTVNITTGGASYINALLASSTVEAGAKVLNLIAYVGGNDSVARFSYVGRAEGDVYLTIKCEFYSTIITGLLTALQAGTNVIVQYGVGSQTNQTRLNLEGMPFGAGGGTIHGPMNVTNIWRYPMRKPIFLSGDRTLAFADSGYLFINDTTNDYVITLPDTDGQGDPAFLFCYEATFLNLSTGSISFVADGAASLIGATVLDQIAQRANCTLISENEWEVDAQASGGGTNQSAIVISPTVFNYFNQILTGTVLWISSSAPNTQGSFSGSTSADYGTFTFKAAAGTYNCCVLYPQGTGNGIMQIIFNGGTPTDIDQYGTNVNQYVSYQFPITLTEGDNTIQLLTNGKNASSSNYFLALADSIVLNRTGA